MRRRLCLLAGLLAALAAPAAAQTAPPPTAGAAAPAASIAPWREGDRTLGADSAPVTLTVYLSTVCSHCAAWHMQEFPVFRGKYVDTGQVRVVFRDLPTPPAELAMAGGVMARCAAEDRYDEALGALFDGQQALAEGQGAVDDRIIIWLMAGGRAGGLDVEGMSQCLSDPAHMAEMEARAAQSAADGVRSTPAFLLDGVRLPYEQARDPAALDALIQQRLAAH